jgi:dTDP-4-dehydrorhamnose reductase
VTAPERPLVLVGAAGQLGRDLARRFAAPSLVPLTRDDLDVTDRVAVERTLVRLRPAVVLNAVAYNKVDEAEDAEPGAAFAVNALGAHHLARAATSVGARLVHFSTDYVFGGGGPGPFVETDPPWPVQVYGVSKLAGEQLVTLASPDHLVIRTCGLYGLGGSRTKRGNFVETMLRLAEEGAPIRVVEDQILTPTYTVDVANAVAQLLAAAAPGGIYHLTNAGECSFFEFARTLFALAGVSPDLRPTTLVARRAPARRAGNTVLRDTRLRALGLPPLRPWPEALAAYLADRRARHRGTGAGPLLQ